MGCRSTVAVRIFYSTHINSSCGESVVLIKVSDTQDDAHIRLGLTLYQATLTMSRFHGPWRSPERAPCAWKSWLARLWPVLREGHIVPCNPYHCFHVNTTMDEKLQAQESVEVNCPSSNLYGCTVDVCIFIAHAIMNVTTFPCVCV